MEKANISFKKMMDSVPLEIQQEVDLEFAISNKIYDLMESKGLSKVQFAQALGRRPCEVTKWLSGQHNFTIRTIAMLTTFFGEPLIQV